MKDLRRVLDDIVTAAQAGLQEAGEHLLEKAQDQTPVDTGDLRDSGRTRPAGDLKQVVEFRDPVSIIVHENQQAEHKRGNAKFLENAMNSEKDRAAQIVAARVRRDLGS